MSLPEKPLTRRELYLAKAAGQDVTLPETDLTREEMYLREIANGGGGGDVTKEYVDTAIANAVADIDDDISALSDTVADKVDKVNGKGLSTNDYTDADKALAQNSPITVTATASPISTANGKPRAITIYGKSEVVDGVIKSAGEGYAVVDLGTLGWLVAAEGDNCFYTLIPNTAENLPTWTTKYTKVLYAAIGTTDKAYCRIIESTFIIHDSDFTTPQECKLGLSGVLLCYKEATPTNNTIAVKTDNGTGVDGTMATFSTGTPLRGIPDTTVRDVMTWDGSAGTVTKNCGEVDLGTLDWLGSGTAYFTANVNIDVPTASQWDVQKGLCSLFTPRAMFFVINPEEGIDKSIAWDSNNIRIKDTAYTDATAFKTAMSGVMLVYELATPTKQALTSTENTSIAALRTFAPTTHIQNNAGADMKIEAYANTANGQAISDMQPTRSPLLTLTASGWTNNAQTVTFVHDTGRRNSIDVEPTSIKAWTAAGVLATAETASTITFECDTVPTADLSFRVTSMEVR